MTDQPNILFVITDQQRADHAGFMGNPVVRTPNIDRLAGRGTVFENAWVANPVCMPNRCSIMTGRVPSAHGVIFNDRSLEPGANTFVRRLREQGYRTGLIGKSHLQHGTSRNSMVPFRGEPASRDLFPEDWNTLEDFERYLPDAPAAPEDFYGFDHIEMALDHGARISGHHLLWALEQGGNQADLLVDYTPESPARHRSEHWWQIYQPVYPPGLHSTSFVTERTQAFIRSAAGAGKPWLAWCSYPDPHHPMTPPGEWFFRHKPEDMVLPENRHDPLADAPAHLRLFRDLHPRQQRNWVAPCGYGSDDLLREAIAATYGMIEMIDDGVGQIVQCIEETGAADNTIIVFTSDHGDMMGEHGLFLKGFMHYRGTLQVPLIISTPGRPAARTGSLACSMDLGPTLLDLCGISGYEGIQGVSLTPVLDDPARRIRDSVLIEDDVANITAKLTPIPAKTRTLITQGYRYTRNSKQEEQLFDLSSDPDEMIDRSGSDAATRAQLMEALADALIAADDASRGAPVSAS